MSLRERKTEKMKEDIIQAAVSIISEKGYHGTTMEDIAAKLLMTKGSMYYYFKDKQELVYETHKMLLEQSVANIEEISVSSLSSVEKVNQAMTTHIDYLISELAGFSLGAKPEQLFADDKLQNILELRAKYGEMIDSLIREGVESGEFRKVDVKIIRNILLGAMNYVVEWYSPEGSKSKEELAQMISHNLLRILVEDTK